MTFPDVDGWTVRQILDEQRAQVMPVPFALAVHIIRGVCRALADDWVLNRTVGPMNVLVSKHGEVQAVRLGITPPEMGYMSPEHLRQEVVDARADVFSLGVMLFELTVGKPLFSRPIARDTVAAILEGPIPTPMDHAPGYAPDLAEVVVKAIARDRRDRHADLRALDRELHLVAMAHDWTADATTLARFVRRLFVGASLPPPTAEDPLDSISAVLPLPSEDPLDDLEADLSAADDEANTVLFVTPSKPPSVPPDEPIPPRPAAPPPAPPPPAAPEETLLPLDATTPPAEDPPVPAAPPPPRTPTLRGPYPRLDEAVSPLDEATPLEPLIDEKPLLPAPRHDSVEIVAAVQPPREPLRERLEPRFERLDPVLLLILAGCLVSGVGLAYWLLF